MEISDQLHDTANLTPGVRSRYPLGRRLEGPKIRFGHCGVEKIFCPFQESNPGRPSQQPIAIPTELSRLNLENCRFITGLQCIYSG
jgi:hypothetical protein